MEELPKRRKNAKKAERPKREQTASEKRPHAADLSANAESLFKFAAIPLMLFTVYAIASLYTPYTGNFGAHIAAFLLSQIGGAVIVPLLFLLYFFSASVLSRGKGNLYRHLGAAAAFFLLLSLLFGLNRLTSYDEQTVLSWNSAGRFGTFLSVLIYRTTGAIGTFIAGAICLYLIFYSYNIRILSYIKLPKIHLPRISLFYPARALARLLVRRKETGPLSGEKPGADVQQKNLPEDNLPDEAAAGEGTSHEGTAQDSENAVKDEALNISECEDEPYFAHEEETPEGFSMPEPEPGAGEEYDGKPRARYRITKTSDAYGTEYKMIREPDEEPPVPEQQEEAPKIKTPPAEVTEPVKNMPVKAEKAPVPENKYVEAAEYAEEEGIDYNDPDSIKLAEERESDISADMEVQDDCEAVQDPNFSYEYPGAGRIRQGIFPPPIDIFGPPEAVDEEMDEEKAQTLGGKIVSTLSQFGIESQLAEILVGPTVIQFRIQLAPGVKVSKVAALSNDIALAMAVSSLRIEAPIPGKPYVGIEIPNPKRRGIPLRTVIEGRAFSETDLMLPLPFGVAVNGEPVVVGLEELPHLLVAGTTGSGKSVFVNSCIVGLCSKRTPEELRMILVDPKRVEMAVYDRLPHLLTPPVTDPKKAVQALAWLIREMEKRYSAFAKLRVRNLTGYNEKVLPKDRIPHIVVVVDELADLMMTAAKEVEEYICRLAQMARATGIHLMLATQRPSVNIITGLIKANIPARVAFTLPSNADSRTIIDCAGAEKLLGKGDMLFSSTKHPKPIRVQSPWIADQVLADWLKYMTNTFGEPQFIKIEDQGNGSSGGNAGSFDDELLEEAVDMVLSKGIASASGLQRWLRIGFSRASRLIDMMEQLGIVGAADGARPREILVDEDTAKEILEEAGSGGGAE